MAIGNACNSLGRCDKLTAKEYLNAIRTTDKLINIKNEELYHLQLKVAQISPQTKAERVLSSSTSDFMRTVDKIVDLQNEINREIDYLITIKDEARSKINRLSDNRYKAVLIDYYINCKTWEQVAEDLQYDLRWVYRIHGRALQEFSKFIN